MGTLPTAYIALVILCAGLVILTVWSQRGLRARSIAVLMGAAVVFTGYFSLADLLGLPKPLWLEWRKGDVKEASVLSAHIAENEKIYVWLLLPGEEEPYSLALPWDKKQAEELQRAMREARNNRTGLSMKSPFEPTWDRQEPKFYALPQPKFPDKEPPPPPPKEFGI